MSARTSLLVASVGSALTVIVWYALLPTAGPSPTARPARAPVAVPAAPAAPAARELAREPALPKAAEPTRVASVNVAQSEPAAAVAEHSLMSRLRELGDSSPVESLALARQGNQLFPDSPEAAERAWYVCKSLVNLESFAEARDEARAMVARYPDTPWAADVQRHLLVNPLDLPGDRAPGDLP